MSERIDNEPAYILHTRPWRETSLIVEAYSARYGRLPLVARGARRAHSSLKAKLVSFQPLWLSWFGKGGLRTLHGTEWQGGGLALKGRALMCGFYVNELLLKLLPPDDPHEVLYARYEAALQDLGSCPDPEPVLRRFELALLSDLGYAQTLDRLSGGDAVLADRRYGYAYGQGVVEADTGDAAYSGRTLLDLAAGDFSNPRTLSEGKLFMRALINHYLGDKPLYTRQLLLDLQTL